ncbi:MAG: Xaa-Pro peptidase family protein [Candidatus Micrarchaeia archaeon]|jgi:Xaa-Pro aminopeptidase
MEKTTAKLIFAPGEKDADIYYATGMSTTDPYLYLEHGRKKVMFASSLECSRAKKIAKCGVEVLPSPKTDTEKKMGAIIMALKRRKIRSASVPYDFPTGLAQKLGEYNIKAIAVQWPQFFKQREVKTEREIKLIAHSQEIAQQAIEEAIEVINASRPDPSGRLLFDGKPLTSEFLHERIAGFLSIRGFEAGETIVCSGEDSMMPHARGAGQLWQDRQIIIDVFPKCLATRYYGDVTRTVFKGEPTGKFLRMYDAVKNVQQGCLDRLREGAVGSELYKFAVEQFERKGYKKTATKVGLFGFTHSLGHGLGLDIHEEPRLSPLGGRLDAGNVVTVEPGLYYPKIGGIRIEDAVVVTKNGCKNLTRLPKDLQII